MDLGSDLGHILMLGVSILVSFGDPSIWRWVAGSLEATIGRWKKQVLVKPGFATRHVGPPFWRPRAVNLEMGWGITGGVSE